ncbi:hypothetical protein DN412_29080 [Cupriavidus lacunae]|uniref:Uncharacterized protein n=1 Tax=Cupriavidus lacunae TaxID=2666307 RepID=A0A370NMT9_9BURK|nr:hypothetical protein DN412_29080 [Cupriavidus lacunae]
MKRQFTRHVQRSGQAYPGRLAEPMIRSVQRQSKIRPVQPRPEGLLIDFAAASLESMQLQRLLQQCDWNGHL